MDDDQAWRDHAACRGLDPDEVTEVFFPPLEALQSIGRTRRQSARQRAATAAAAAAAAEFCDWCEVRHDCLEYALHRNLDGIWAGTIPEQRREMRVAAGIALIEDADPSPATETPETAA